MNKKEPSRRITSVDALRGIAALAVTWFHFTNGYQPEHWQWWLKTSGSYGWLGLNIFFVLSGFVIPFSLHASGFRLRGFGRYVVKRVVRLDPPYLVCIGMIILLNYASARAPGFAGTPFVFSLPQFAAHLGYVNSFLGYSWYNPAFWTLAIEFQWYLFVALIFPLLASANPARRWLVWAAFAWLPHLSDSQVTLFHFLPLFAVGAATFQVWARIISRNEYFFLLALFGISTGLVMEAPVGIVAVLTALAIVYWKAKSRWLLAAGAISYSLYLVHVPIGGRVINLSRHWPETLPTASLALTMALVLTLGVAYLLWRFVEKPSMRAASKISTSKTKTESMCDRRAHLPVGGA